MKEIAKEINLDMDGTIADLYGVDNWLDDLINKRTRPYAEAKPLVNLQSLARILNRLKRNGYKINIISWLAKNSNFEYDEEVTKAKKEWLAKHLKSVKFDSIKIVAYGTPKNTLGTGYLFDDEFKNRAEWGLGARDAANLIAELKAL